MELLFAFPVLLCLVRRRRNVITWVSDIFAVPLYLRSRKKSKICFKNILLKTYSNLWIVHSPVCTPVGFVRLFDVVGSFLV